MCKVLLKTLFSFFLFTSISATNASANALDEAVPRLTLKHFVPNVEIESISRTSGDMYFVELKGGGSIIMSQDGRYVLHYEEDSLHRVSDIINNPSAYDTWRYAGGSYYGSKSGAELAIRAAREISRSSELSLTELKETPVEDLFSVIVNGHAVMYILDGSFLIDGSLLDIHYQRNLTDDINRRVRAELISQLDPDSLIEYKAGDHNSDHTATVFVEIGEEYSRLFFDNLAAYKQAGIDIRVAAVHRGVEFTESAYKRQKAAWCAKDKKKAFELAMRGAPLQELASLPGSAISSCSTFVHKFSTNGMNARLGMLGVPTFYMASGDKLDGYIAPDILVEYLASREAIGPAEELSRDASLKIDMINAELKVLAEQQRLEKQWYRHVECAAHIKAATQERSPGEYGYEEGKRQHDQYIDKAVSLGYKSRSETVRKANAWMQTHEISIDTLRLCISNL